MAASPVDAWMQDCMSKCPGNPDNSSCVCIPPLSFFESPPPPYYYHYNPKPQNSDAVIIVVVLVVVLVFVCCSCMVKQYSEENAVGTFTATPANNTQEDHHQPPQNPIDNRPPERTVGLEESMISSIAVFKYKSGDGLVEGTECSVCLNDFREDEHLRLLPNCSHAFHLPCIDAWLRSHVNCPLCRASVHSTATQEASSSTTNTAGSSSISSQNHIAMENRGRNGVVYNQRLVHDAASQARFIEEHGSREWAIKMTDNDHLSVK